MTRQLLTTLLFLGALSSAARAETDAEIDKELLERLNDERESLPLSALATPVSVTLAKPGAHKWLSILCRKAGQAWIEPISGCEGLQIVWDRFTTRKAIGTGLSVRVPEADTLRVRLSLAKQSGPATVRFRFRFAGELPLGASLVFLSTAAGMNDHRVEVPQTGLLVADLEPNLRLRPVLEGGKLSPLALENGGAIRVTKGPLILRVLSENPSAHAEGALVRLRWAAARDDLAPLDGKPRTIELGRTYWTHLASKGARRRVTFRVKRKGYLRVDVGHAPTGACLIGRAVVQVTGPDGKRSQETCGSRVGDLLLEPGQEYTCHLTQFRSLTTHLCALRFTLERHEDRRREAKPLLLNVPTRVRTNPEGSLHESKDVAWFRLEVPEPGILQVVATDDHPTDSPARDVKLFRADGKALVKVLRQAQAGRAFVDPIEPDRAIELEQAGTYLLRVASTHGKWFRLTANFASIERIGKLTFRDGLAMVYVGLGLKGKARLAARAEAGAADVLYLEAKDAKHLGTVLEEALRIAEGALPAPAPAPVEKTSGSTRTSARPLPDSSWGLWGAAALGLGLVLCGGVVLRRRYTRAS